MKKSSIITLLLFLLPLLMQAQASPRTLKQLEGRWYVIMSDFPMWTKGKKTNPSFQYTIETRKGKQGLRDEVICTKKGKTKTIRGFDTPGDSTNTAFTWRGKGLLKLLKSKWELVAIDTAGQWMLIHFERTLFTPEGYDVISRSKTLPPASAKDLVTKLSAISLRPEMKKVELQVIPQS